MFKTNCPSCGFMKEARDGTCPQCIQNSRLVRELAQLPLELRTLVNDALTKQQVERAKANKLRERHASAT